MKKTFVLMISLLLVGMGTQAANENVAKSKKKNQSSLAEMGAMTSTSLSGLVIDHETGEGLAGVAIQLEGLNQVVYTDFEGNFKLEGVVPGQYNITSSYISYQEKELKNVNVSGINNAIRLELKKD
ncbi:MAG: carboxypeptidase-like regulatory domain-containing protein [Marinifilaceae bacterium]